MLVFWWEEMCEISSILLYWRGIALILSWKGLISVSDACPSLWSDHTLYRIISSEIYWPNKDRNCGKHLGTGAAAPSANTCSSLSCVPYEFRDLLMWSDFRKHETCRVEQPDFSVVMLQAFMWDKVNEFSGFMVLHRCQSKLLFWDTGLQIQKSN